MSDRAAPKILFIEYCAKDFLDGVQVLDAMEELAYRRIIDLIYSTNDRLPDDDRKLAWMTKAGRKWSAIKKTLVEAGKIIVVDGRVTNDKCQLALQKSAKNIAQKSVAGSASADARKSRKNKETASTAVGSNDPTAELTAVSSAVPTNQEPKNPVEEDRGCGSAREPTEDAPEIRYGLPITAWDIADLFEKLRDELWPTEAALPAPTMTIASQINQYLAAGAPPQLLREITDREMRAAAADGKRAPGSFLVFKHVIPKAIDLHRQKVNLDAPGNSKSAGATAAVGETRNIFDPKFFGPVAAAELARQMGAGIPGDREIGGDPA